MSFSLLIALEKRLEAGFCDAKFRVPDKDPGSYITPRFFIGAIPAKRKKNDPLYEDQEDFPFIVNRFKGGTDQKDDSSVTVRTLCGIYTAGDPAAGENDVANMIMRCRRLILQSELLDRRYCLVYPIVWGVGDPEEKNAQPHPFYSGEILTTWAIPVVENNLSPEEEKKIYGYFG